VNKGKNTPLAYECCAPNLVRDPGTDVLPFRETLVQSDIESPAFLDIMQRKGGNAAGGQSEVPS
jgi:hypothetical protein